MIYILIIPFSLLILAIVIAGVLEPFLVDEDLDQNYTHCIVVYIFILTFTVTAIERNKMAKLNLSYKDIQFIIIALNHYQTNLRSSMESINEDIVSEAGNDYLFVKSLISKLKNEI